MSRDDRIVKYGAVYVPEEKVKETAKRGAPKSSGKMDEIEEAIRELQDEMKKSNRDNLDAMYNIDEDNLSSSYRKKIDGQFIAAYSAIKTWADSQSAGFEAVAKWQSETENKLKGYVEKTTLNTSIKSYIDGNAGKAAIVSAVTGSFVKIDTNTGITTTSDVISKISQEVSNGIAKLTLSVSNGEESSVISLKNGEITLASKTITLSGLVSFTDLSTKGATTINGDNITTGKISAALVDTSDLVVENVWLKSSIDSQAKSILTSKLLSQNNLSVQLGVQENKEWAQYIELYGTAVYISSPGTTPATDSNALMFDVANRAIIPASEGKWRLGTDVSEFDAVYVDNAYVSEELYFRPGTRNESSLWVSSSGNLKFTDRNGTDHTLIDL